MISLLAMQGAEEKVLEVEYEKIISQIVRIS